MPFYSHTHFPLTATANPVSISITSVLSRILYKCNHIEHNLWDSLFPLSIILWRFIQVVVLIAFPFTAIKVCKKRWGKVKPHWFNHSLVGYFHFEAIMNKAAIKFVCRFFCDHKPSLHWNKCPECNC